MPPRYPFNRSHPSSSNSSHPYNPQSSNPDAGPSNANGHHSQYGQPDDRPIVVSASGRLANPASPGNALTVDSPSTLRARIASPRNANDDAFQNDTSSYPSPSQSLTRGKGGVFGLKRKKNKSEGGGRGWMQLDSDSPTRLQPNTNVINVPRYDARGYPQRDRPPDPKHSPESSKSVRFDGNYANASGLRPSSSRDSLASDVSSTGAGVNGEESSSSSNGRWLSTHRPSSYYAPIDGASPNTLYPPNMNYNLNAPSYSPYGPPPEDQMGNPMPVPSLYGDSRVSLNSINSEGSTTQFRKYDSLGKRADGGDRGYEAFSISSKGGKRHIADMFSLPADPATWSYLGPEADDDFHDPDFLPSRRTRFLAGVMTWRGVSNIGCLVLLLLILVTLFCVYPILSFYLRKTGSSLGGYNLGGINATGQIPNIGPFQLIDADTPQSAYSHTSLETGDTWELIFSDEFNRDGRTFYDGDDPYWEAVDLHYWSTNNLEWYDPRQLTTKGGSLIVTLDNITNHGLNYMGGMMSTWNRFCFTGGYVEASVSLPGKHNVYGLWPAIWAMGNLGRAGYGGTLDGMWPYTYDSCDVGTLANQTQNGKPEIATYSGPDNYGNVLSYLPGQRLSRCTCSNDATHPGPRNSEGGFVGRAAPEIDMFEATVDSTTLVGEVSQSGQWAPFNPYYEFINTSKTYEIYDDDVTKLNSYQGGVYQQATSGLAVTNQDCYTQDTGCFSTYGFEYKPGGAGEGYVTWVNDGKKSWTVRADAMGPNTAAGVGQRLVSEEPMYLIVNLGISENFGAVDYTGLAKLWPVTMAIDYIRVYQDPNNRNIGCDPPTMPTASYIARFADAYNDPNITVMGDIPNFTMPKNSLIDTC